MSRPVNEMTPAMIRFELEHMDGDPESDHIRADELLCEALRQLGGNDIAEAFEAAGKNFWYA